MKAAGERAEMDRKALGSDHLRAFSSRKMRLIRRTALLLFLSGSGRLLLELSTDLSLTVQIFHNLSLLGFFQPQARGHKNRFV